MKFYQSKEFKKLNNKWQKELRKSDFVDIEQPDGKYLKKYHSVWFAARYNLDYFKGKKEFFEEATRFYHTGKFKNQMHKDMWLDYSNGAKLREMVEKYPLKSARISVIIRQYTKEMLNGLKNKRSEAE